MMGREGIQEDRGLKENINIFVIQEGEIRVEIERSTKFIRGNGREYVSETIAMASPEKMAEALGLSIREANKLKMDLLSRLKNEDPIRYEQQRKIWDLKQALEGLSLREAWIFLSMYRDGDFIHLLFPESYDSLRKMRVGEKAQVVADYLLNKEIIELVNIDMDPDTLFVADRGILRDPKGIIRMLAGRLIGGLCTRQVINEIADRCFTRSRTISWDQLDPIRYIAFDDRIFDLHDFRFVSHREMKDHQGRPLYLTRTLDISIDPEFIDKVRNGEIELDYFEKGDFFPAIMRFYLDENGEKGKDWLMIHDVLGSILAPASMKLIAIIWGPPNTGKTVLIKSIKDALGPYALYLHTTQISEDMFSRAELFGKRVVLSSEEMREGRIDTDLLKSISGGDPLSARPIYSKLREQSDNPIKVIMAGNRIRKFSSIDEGLFNRIRIIRTYNPLSDDEVDRDILGKTKLWRKEVLELLLWELRRLQLLNYVITDIDPLEKYQRLTKAQNPLSDFVETCLIQDPNGRELAKDLYEIYLEYTRKKGIKEVIGRNKFYDYLSDFFSSAYIHKEKVFLGVRIRDDWSPHPSRLQ
jgi:hypothetical protein